MNKESQGKIDKNKAFNLEGINHFVGIGGSGMNALAQILLEKGFLVTGSDLAESPAVDRLRNKGAQIKIGHNANAINENTKCVIYSSAIKSDNPEIVAAKNLGLKVISRAELLAEIMAQGTSVAVAGAHGKTSTTGMLASILENSKIDATIAIGGYLPCIEGNAKAGSDKYIVAEVDESDGSFLILHPEIAIVTNVEDDHLDHYKTVENIHKAFKQFCEQIPKSGFLVLNNDCPVLKTINPSLKQDKITYGIKNNADYKLTDIKYSGAYSSGKVWEKENLLGELKIKMPGEYNLSNALATVALTRKLGLSFAEIADGLAHFTGTGRRFEIIGKANDITVVDDFAHHPTELKSVLGAAQNMGYNRVVGVFQPHRYSRTKAKSQEFGEACINADIMFVNEIYSAHEKPIPGVSAKQIVEAAKKHGQEKIYYAEDQAEILENLKSTVKPGDLVLVMGVGNIRQVAEKFAAWLEKTNN